MSDFLITDGDRAIPAAVAMAMDPVPDGVWVPHVDDPEPVLAANQKKVTDSWTVRRDENGTPIAYGQTWKVVERPLSERIGPKTKLQLVRKMTQAEASAFDNWLAALAASGVEAYESAAREWNAAQEIDPFDELTAQMLVVLEQQGLFTHDRILELFAL